MDKGSTFSREVLLYSGLISEERIAGQISLAEWQSSKQIPRMSAKCRGGIKCDRRK
jgi:hypothetical protein